MYMLTGNTMMAIETEVGADQRVCQDCLERSFRSHPRYRPLVLPRIYLLEFP
jgi:hypothetical protein